MAISVDYLFLQMELRSGTVVASGGGFVSAEAARAACLGQARVQLPPAALPTFASGVRGVLARWTALRLAREHGWGGDDTDAKAATLEEAVLGWFCAKGACRAVCCCGSEDALAADAVPRRSPAR